MILEDIKVNKEIKIVFMGTSNFAVPVLENLIKNYKVKAIITQPDRPFGRKAELKSPPVKKVGNDNNILVLQPEKIGTITEELKQMNPDLIVTCAYGQIIPKEMLEIPRLGCINVHASLLPKLRGGAPIHRAIINGFTKTGITIMYMNEKMDAGDIISQEEIIIEDIDTASTLSDKLSIVGSELLIKTLPSIINGTNTRIKQDLSQVTLAFNIKREDERIDFSKSKRAIYNQVRGLNSWPGAYCLFDNKILKVWNCTITDNYFPEKINGEITAIYDDGFGIKVSNGEIILTEVQLEGKNKIPASSFINGFDKDYLIGKILD